MTGTAPRPLEHLQDFDSASRNALGAAALLPKVLRHNPVASMAAVVTIASLAVGPMVQQSIRTADCALPTAVNRTGASIPYARFVPRTRGYNRYAQNGLWILCPTGNCTFPAGDPIENGDTTEEEYTGEPVTSYTTVGLCSRCVDITSLITVNRDPETFSDTFTLPNGLRLRYRAGLTDVLTSNMTNPGLDDQFPDHGHVDWAGDLVPPEAAFSFSNLTVLARSSAMCKEAMGPGGVVGPYECPYSIGPLVAVICPIYPCMRTYQTTVIHNKVRETKIGSAPLLPAVVPGVRNWDTATIYTNTSGRVEVPLELKIYASYPYVGIKSPCRSKDGAEVYTRQNMSLATNTTSLSICDKLQPNGRYNTTQATTPPECLYMHGAGFGMALNKEFGGVLAGECSTHIRSQDDGPGCSALTDGLDGWLHSLYNNASASVESIQGFMESVTQAMTNYYRREIGSSDYDPEQVPRTDLPPGVILGTVWKSNICNSIQWEWLALPASLAALTLVLLAWTVVRSWTHRYDEPVWKDNVLPAMFYRERFETAKGNVVGLMGSVPGAQGASQERGEREARLAETAEMEDIAKKTLVSFRVPERGAGDSALNEEWGTSPMGNENRLFQRRPRRLSLDSLLASEGHRGGI